MWNPIQCVLELIHKLGLNPWRSLVSWGVCRHYWQVGVTGLSWASRSSLPTMYNFQPSHHHPELQPSSSPPTSFQTCVAARSSSKFSTRSFIICSSSRFGDKHPEVEQCVAICIPDILPKPFCFLDPSYGYLKYLQLTSFQLHNNWGWSLSLGQDYHIFLSAHVLSTRMWTFHLPKDILWTNRLNNSSLVILV